MTPLDTTGHHETIIRHHETIIRHHEAITRHDLTRLDTARKPLDTASYLLWPLDAATVTKTSSDSNPFRYFRIHLRVRVSMKIRSSLRLAVLLFSLHLSLTRLSRVDRKGTAVLLLGIPLLSSSLSHCPSSPTSRNESPKTVRSHTRSLTCATTRGWSPPRAATKKARGSLPNGGPRPSRGR